MRISALLVGFSVGAYAMWKVAAPLPDMPPPCAIEAPCAVPQAAPVARPAPRQDLRVVVYDPATDPSPRMEQVVSRDRDGLTASDRLDAPVQPAGFRLVAMNRPDANGVCAVLDGETVRCVGFLDPRPD